MGEAQRDKGCCDQILLARETTHVARLNLATGPAYTYAGIRLRIMGVARPISARDCVAPLVLFVVDCFLRSASWGPL
jgi:hypothetical protein